MAANGYGPAPVAGHVGRIPNYGKSQVNPMGSVEPPACIQNAMMTKDKKPFTYTPGGLDLSQIRTPSMARRMARQRSLEEHEQAYGQQAPGGNYHPQGGPGAPPPPPIPASKVPAPPPPPPLVIEAPQSKSPKPVLGERPEIVIPENPIGMLRKTNSPYHWEAEKAELQKMGAVPKFQDKVPSPLTVKMPPSSFSQQPPQSYTPQGQNFQRPNYSYGNNNQPESPIHRPEAQYASQKSSPSPNVNGSPITRELLQRQDSQFNKSPQPFAGQSPVSAGSPYSPTPNNNWRQSERRDSPANNVGHQSPQISHNQFSPNTQQQYSPNYQNPVNNAPTYHTLPRSAPRIQDNHVNNVQNNTAIYNNVRETAPKVDSSDPYPWRTNTVNKQPREPENIQSIYHNSQNINQQPKYTPPWANSEAKTNQQENSYIPPWKQENKNVSQHQQLQQHQPQQYSPRSTQECNNNKPQENYSPQWKNSQNDNRPQVSPPTRQNQPSQETPRYQSTMSIPVTPRKPNTQPEQNNNVKKEVVYVNQEPVYFCPESPKSIPPWVKTQKEKTKTPPPVWCQRPLDGRKSLPRELVTPPREIRNQEPEPEWVRKSNEMQRGTREIISPPKYQQSAHPNWSTRPSENRKSLPRDNAPGSPGTRVIPIQMEVSSSDQRDHGRQGNQMPPLRIVINMQPGQSQAPYTQVPQDQQTQAPYSQPTQRIMRVLSPQLVKLDDGSSQNDLPSLNRSFQNAQESNGPKERIIPIQIEGGGNSGANKRVYYHKFTQEAPIRQSKAFRVLQIITGTQDTDDVQGMENQHGFTDL